MFILQPSVCSVQLLDPIDEDDPGLLSFNVVETLETYVPERWGCHLTQAVAQ